MALVLCTAGAMAQTVVTTINTEMSYTLECKSGYAHSTTRFIGVTDAGVINGQSAAAAYITFEAGEDAGSYYIKVGEKYINCDGTNLSASETKSTAWILGTVDQTVTFKYPNSTLYLNNNGTTCTDGTITGLKANNHSSGPTAANACSTWEMKEYDESAIVAAWKTNNATVFGYVGSYPESARDAIEGVASYSDIEAFEANNEKIALSTDAYYRLVCVAPKTGNSGDTSYNTLTFNGSSNLVTAPTDNSNINQIFKFEDAGDGKFYLKNMNADGYLNKISAGTYRSAIVTEADACKLQILAYDATAQWELNNSEGAANHSLFAENHPTEAVPYACSGWDSGANSASAWYIIPANDIEITVNEYATVYLPFAVSVESATAYAVTTTETWATLTEKEDIPANEGAILAGNGTAKLNIISAATSDWNENMLEGTTISQDVTPEGTGYVLSKPAEGIGFYRAVTEGKAEGTFLNNANKAYLVVPTAQAEGVASYSFRFGEGTTGVEKVEIRNEKSEIYDLTGRCVESISASGIYIVNGKKVLVK